MKIKAEVEEERLAKLWWERLPADIKGRCSIWTILALYAQHTLQTRSVCFGGDQKTAEVGRG